MRRDDWEECLAAFIADNRDREFQWGEWDCILFATACAAELTGEDKAEAFRGQYGSKAGARAILRTLGQGTLLRTVNHHFVRKPASHALRGDLVWYRGCVGVSLGTAAAFITDPVAMDAMDAPRLGQFVLVPRADWQRAWAV